MSDFHQQAIEDVARAMGRSPGRLGYAIKNGGLGVKAKELAYAVAQRERVLELEAQTKDEGSWVCSECGSAEYSGSVSSSDVSDEVLPCGECGAREFHWVQKAKP